MEKLPQYSSELIRYLDTAVPYLEFPMTLEGISDLSESQLRRLAFKAGQRAMVDDLLTLLNEDNEDAGNGDESVRNNDGSVGSGVSLLTRPDGEGTIENEFEDRG